MCDQVLTFLYPTQICAALECYTAKSPPNSAAAVASCHAHGVHSLTAAAAAAAVVVAAAAAAVLLLLLHRAMPTVGTP
jgi:hypothetical protein